MTGATARLRPYTRRLCADPNAAARRCIELEPRGASAGQCAAQRDLGHSNGGEIMGLLDGLIGGAVGAEMVTVVNSLIQQHGGIQGVVTQLESQGLGGVARSWISSGPNQAISPAQV